MKNKHEMAGKGKTVITGRKIFQKVASALELNIMEGLTSLGFHMLRCAPLQGLVRDWHFIYRKPFLINK